MKNTSVLIGLALAIPLAMGMGGCAKTMSAFSSFDVKVPPPSATAAAAAPRTVTASEVTAAIQKLPTPDREFVEQAAGANMSAIRFGQLASERGSTPEVRDFGKQMVDTHTALSDQLRRSAASKGITLPIAQLTSEQLAGYERLSKLSGREFDEAYLRDVKKVQKETIASFQNEALNGQVNELATFANQSLPTLNEHIRTAQAQIRRM